LFDSNYFRIRQPGDQAREMLKGRYFSPGSACVPQAAFGILPDADFRE
jgi:hypothetical protein